MMTRAEKDRAKDVLRVLIRARNRLAALGKSKDLMYSILCGLSRRRTVYADLCLAWRVYVGRGQAVWDGTFMRSVEEMRGQIVHRLMLKTPTREDARRTSSDDVRLLPPAPRPPNADNSDWSVDWYVARCRHHSECWCRRCSGARPHPQGCFCGGHLG